MRATKHWARQVLNGLVCLIDLLNKRDYIYMVQVQATGTGNRQLRQSVLGRQQGTFSFEPMFNHYSTAASYIRGLGRDPN